MSITMSLNAYFFSLFLIFFMSLSIFSSPSQISPMVKSGTNGIIRSEADILYRTGM